MNIETVPTLKCQLVDILLTTEKLKYQEEFQVGIERICINKL